MKNKFYRTLVIISAMVFLHSFVMAQTPTCVGLVLKIDSSDNVLMPRIVSIVPNSPADADTSIKPGMYVLKVGNDYCRNTALDYTTHRINGEEGTPATLIISDSKDVFPRFAYTLRRGTPVH
jgi:C-terminal processing protease CtpA/Prc